MHWGEKRVGPDITEDMFYVTQSEVNDILEKCEQTHAMIEKL